MVHFDRRTIIKSATAGILSAELTSHPVSAADIDTPTVYFVNRDASLYAVSLENGSLQWELDVDGRSISSPTVRNGTVYFGSDERVIAVLPRFNRRSA